MFFYSSHSLRNVSAGNCGRHRSAKTGNMYLLGNVNNKAVSI